jgi:transposase
MAQRYELSDEQYALIEPLLPVRAGRGGAWRDHRQVLNGILWCLFSGAPWRDMPQRYGSFKTANGRLSRWRANGMWDHILATLRLHAGERGLLDATQWNVDTTSIRATRAAGGAKRGASTETLPLKLKRSA